MRLLVNTSLAVCVLLACSLANAKAQEAVSAASALTVELVRPDTHALVPWTPHELFPVEGASRK